MPEPLSPDQLTQLRTCLELAHDPAQQTTATELFNQLRQAVSQDAATQSLLDLLWNEILTARRSGAFWQQLSDAEKEMFDRVTQHSIQLQQNYLRLVQEQ